MPECYKIKEGINLYHINTKKFKTVSASVNLHRPLCREEASNNALLAEVMHRGNATYKNTVEIAKYLQSLYGAGFDTSIKRKGEDQIISFSINVIADKYTNGEPCVKDALLMLFGMLLDPLLEDGGFLTEYVEQEKVNLINTIEAMINDKRSYSMWRLIELMCAGDRYAVYELGSVGDVEVITPGSLYEHYKKIILTSPIDIFVTGEVDINDVIDSIKKSFEKISPREFSYPECNKYTSGGDIQNIEEKFDVTQAKLCIGFKTDILPSDKDYPALMVYSGILGGGPHSKLFNNVREKLSLAYYAASRLERYKGIMLIASGIEINNKQKALDEIFLQIDAMKSGEITNYEYTSAIKSIVNSLKAFSDDVRYCEDYYLGQLVTKTMISLDEYADSIAAVTIDDVVSVAQKITPQMIYFLTAEDGGNSNEA